MKLKGEIYMKKVILGVTASAMIGTFALGGNAFAQSVQVERGDSLWEYAQDYNTSVSEIKNLNELTSNTIYVGQTIKLPTNESEVSTVHTVERGDYLYKIGEKYGVDYHDIIKWNDLKTNYLYVGQKLVVSSNATSDSNESQSSYTVQSGDYLGKIANKFDTTVSSIMKLNNLNSTIIHPGQVLKVNGEAVETSSNTTSTSTTTNNDSSSVQVDELISNAKEHIGTPYVWGGTTPSGFDCSGFMYYVLNKSGYDVGRTNVAGYWELGDRTNNPQKGDLVYFQGTYKAGPSHMGIYLGNGKFIHASSSKGVTISDVSNSYWSSHFLGYRSL